MKETISKQLDKLLRKNADYLEYHLLMRNIETLEENTHDNKMDQLRYKFLKSNDIELAAKLNISIFIFNKKLEEFTFNNKELKVILNYFNILFNS